jgi:hypothetical protein
MSHIQGAKTPGAAAAPSAAASEAEGTGHHRAEGTPAAGSAAPLLEARTLAGKVGVPATAAMVAVAGALAGAVGLWALLRKLRKKGDKACKSNSSKSGGAVKGEGSHSVNLHA